MIEVRTFEQVGVLTLCRAEARNALSRAMIAELASALAAFEADPQIRVIVLAGEPVFCAGADIAEMSEMSLMQVLDIHSHPQ